MSEEKSQERTWDAYTRDAADFIPRYESYTTTKTLTGIEEIVAGRSGACLDVGAGTGRDARWLAARSFSVTAVEPSEGMRAYGEQRGGGIDWVDDSLPLLKKIKARNLKYDFILLNACWQHVPVEQRGVAFANLYDLCTKGGRILITLRFGPVPQGRIMYPVSYEECAALAAIYDDLSVSEKEYSRPSLLNPEAIFGRVIIDRN